MYAILATLPIHRSPHGQPMIDFPHPTFEDRRVAVACLGGPNMVG